MSVLVRISVMVALFGALGVLIVQACIHCPIDRAHRFVEIFDDHCVSYAYGMDSPPPDGMVRFGQIEAGKKWLDVGSSLILSRGESGCSVSDVLQPMETYEREVMHALAKDMIANAMPMMPNEPTATDNGHLWKTNGQDIATISLQIDPATQSCLFEANGSDV